MERATTDISNGVLAHLEHLEAFSRKLAMQQEEKKTEQRALAQMRDTIQALKNQRDELRMKVKLRAAGSLPQLMQEHASNAHLDPVEVTQRRRQQILEMKLENVKAMLQDFHLTGISGKMTAQGVCVCITTAYESTYLDSYYVDLILTPHVRICRHSIPPFIPLSDISKKYLKPSLRRFLFVLFDHLNAYAGRKYQADKLKEHAEVFHVQAVQRNSLCNVLSFKYDVKWEDQSFRFCAKLVYGDSTRYLPTEVFLTCKATLPEPVKRKLSAESILFQQKSVHEVFESFRKEEGSASQTVFSMEALDLQKSISN